MKPAEAKQYFPTEAVLCEVFIRDMNAVAGWVCYPETAGFDVLAVHESGRQIGVEAKLQLNAKVADQILPSNYADVYESRGPDHRLVIVSCTTDANEGIARLLRMLGIEVWEPHLAWERECYQPRFDVERVLHYEAAACPGERFRSVAFGRVLHDWNPVERCTLPAMVPNVPAGVPAPVQMTPWKHGALRVLAILRRDGRISARQITEQGISPSMWTQRWLVRAPERGFWLPTESTPYKLAEQHPAEYAVAAAEIETKEAA